MPRVNILTNSVIDEISLVDAPAAQDGKVLIAKRAPEEEIVPEYFHEDGSAVDLDTLEIGDVVYDSDGSAFEVEEDADAAVDTYVQERELAEVGKSLSDRVREELSKSLTDIEKDEVISKAMDEISKAEARATEAEKIAKSERTIRLTREYISKAATFNVPIEDNVLGPVLMRMAELMTPADNAVIEKALEAASDAIYAEYGSQGQGSNNDVLDQVDARIDAMVSKGERIDRHEVVTSMFEDSPAAYDEYLRSQRSGL